MRAVPRLVRCYAGTQSAARRVALRCRTRKIKFSEQADVAQLVEQPIRNRQVTGSSPVVGSRDCPFYPLLPILKVCRVNQIRT